MGNASAHAQRRTIFFRSIHAPPREMFSFALAAFAMDIVGFLYSQTR